MPITTVNLLDYYPTIDNNKQVFTDNAYINTLRSDLSAEVRPVPVRTRLSTTISTRASAKESITTYNALRKVFKARFDENRANLRLSNITGLVMPAPYLNMGRVPFENLLVKNSENFFSKATYKATFKNTFSNYTTLDALLNFYLTDLPFLKSLKSDASRYIWFD